MTFIPISNQTLFNKLSYINQVYTFATVELLADYAYSDMVIFCCNKLDYSNHPFWLDESDLQDDDEAECEYCGQMCARLLSDGMWQTQAERDQLNQVEYQKVSG